MSKINLCRDCINFSTMPGATHIGYCQKLQYAIQGDYKNKDCFDKRPKSEKVKKVKPPPPKQHPKQQPKQQTKPQQLNQQDEVIIGMFNEILFKLDNILERLDKSYDE